MHLFRRSNNGELLFMQKETRSKDNDFLCVMNMEIDTIFDAI